MSSKDWDPFLKAFVIGIFVLVFALIFFRHSLSYIAELNEMSELKDYLTADVVYIKLGFPTKAALLKACQRREIPHIRLSPRKALFDPDEINRFLEARAVEPRRRFSVVDRRISHVNVR